MTARRDRVLRLGTGVTSVKRSLADGVWRALWLPSSEDPQLRLRDVLQWHPFWTRPESVGWFVRALNGTGRLTARLSAGTETLAETVQEIGAAPRPVRLPWPTGLQIPPKDAQLELHADAGAGGVDLLVNRVMDRAPLLALARGEGIEIGPGPKPQIIPSENVSVHYLEEMPQEKWASNYDNTGRRGTAAADWSRYMIGRAHELPVADGSLDFIFSSHVFEHLANPIGHLEHWSKKLRPGGAVLVVCPDIAGGSMDYAMRPSNLAEWQAEHEARIWAPTDSHVERFAAGRGVAAERLKRDSFSVHVHFYDRHNASVLLDYAVGSGLFSGYNLTHSANNKDFYFVCVRGV
jgi:SAM-dependent methyltransferase